MIRKLVLSVAAILGLTAAALIRPVTAAGGQIAALPTLYVTPPGANPYLPPPTLPVNAQNPPSWKVVINGGFTVPLAQGQQAWTVTNVNVVMIPRLGGVSRSYGAVPAAQNGRWTMTSTFAMPPNTYDVFATGDAKLTDMGTIPPTPLDAVTICSPVVSVFVPPNWSPAPLLPNTTQVTKTYATMNFTQGTGRANGVFTGKANASDNGTFIAPPAVTRVNQPTRPVMVVLPTLGGPFEQPNAPWGVYQAPNTPATISTLQLPAATGYNIYMFCKGNVYPDGDTTQPPSNDFQLICTPMLLNQ